MLELAVYALVTVIILLICTFLWAKSMAETITDDIANTIK
ncbi:hypothetical protein Pan3_16 [Pseudanabaena phage Pan3]|nr:hypothetical protein Pan3_16 [Pseudanabaena phage Pan3]